MPVQIESQMAPDAPAATAQPTQIASTGSILGGLVNDLTGGVSGVVTGLVGAGINALTGNTPQDQANRQIATQQQLSNIQVGASEDLSNYQLQNNLQMWQDTSYPAQVQEMEQAGLNPALIYGGGGGSGMTNGSMPVASGGQAADAAEMMAAKTAQTQQIEQMKVMDSQANLNNAQAAKISGVDTGNVQANTNLQNTQANSLTQGIQNQQAQEALTKVQTQQAQLQLEITNHTKTYQYQDIAAQADTAMATARSAMAQANIDETTQNNKINQIQQNYINSILTAANIKENTQLTAEQINGIGAKIQQDWIQIHTNQMNTQNTQEGIELQHQDAQQQLSQDMTKYFTMSAKDVTQAITTILGEGAYAAKPSPGTPRNVNTQ
nr:MAG: DNA pilot protein [Microviridae sp.]